MPGHDIIAIGTSADGDPIQIGQVRCDGFATKRSIAAAEADQSESL